MCYDLESFLTKKTYKVVKVLKELSVIWEINICEGWFSNKMLLDCQCHVLHLLWWRTARHRCDAVKVGGRRRSRDWREAELKSQLCYLPAACVWTRHFPCNRPAQGAGGLEEGTQVSARAQRHLSRSALSVASADPATFPHLAPGNQNS